MIQSSFSETSQALDGTVNQLTESSIKLAEAAANFGALKLMFGIFIVFIFVMMLFYLYQMVAYNKKISDIHKSSKRVEDYFEESANRSLGKAQSNVMIRRAFNSLAQNVKYTILRTRIESKPLPEDRDTISTRVSRLINYEFAELSSFFANFECEDVALADFLNIDDTQILIDFMVEQIFLPKDTYSISNMDKETDILINGIKLDVLKKIG